MSLATKASELTSRYLGEAERRPAADAARRIRESGEETGLSRLLADLVGKGAAFHHAGLPHEHRKIVEDTYRERAVKLLASTPTLAAGVNLPARRVVIADLSRYDGETGMNARISVLEYRQMAGRAGRPQYDEYGETVMIPPPSLQRRRRLMRHYVESSPEPIESRLGGERGMRVHLLAVIASRMGITREEIDSIFSKTLLAAQTGTESVARHVDDALGYLFAEQLVVEKSGAFHATGFGKRISTLYIDPMTGVLFKKNIGGFEPGPDHTVRLLHLIAKSPDFEPKFPMREKHYQQAYEFLETNRASFSLADERTRLVVHGVRRHPPGDEHRDGARLVDRRAEGGHDTREARGRAGRPPQGGGQRRLAPLLPRRAGEALRKVRRDQGGGLPEEEGGESG